MSAVPPVSASGAPRFNRGLHRYACALAGATLLLIAAGGQVKSHEAGLSVPDWPTSYGHHMFTFPPSRWQGGILWEHGHRLIASAVGLMTVIMLAWLHRAEPRRWLRRIGGVALGAVLVQGLLGGITVRYGLPDAVSIVHGCLAQAFFCLTLLIALATSRLWLESTPRAPAGGARPIAYACTAAIFLQLILGAVMRHTESGLAVTDFPLAYGQLWPRTDADSLARYDALRAAGQGLPPVTAEQIQYHMVHRAGAIFVAAVVLLTFFRTRAAARDDAFRNTVGLWMVSLLGLQVWLGASTVLSGRAPLVATLHVACGAALLGASFVLSAWSRRRPAERVESFSAPAALKPVEVA